MLATAVFGVIWGAGVLCGSVVTGQIMAACGPVALPGSIALAYALLIMALGHGALPGGTGVSRAVATA